MIRKVLVWGRDVKIKVFVLKDKLVKCKVFCGEIYYVYLFLWDNMLGLLMLLYSYIIMINYC